MYSALFVQNGNNQDMGPILLLYIFFLYKNSVLIENLKVVTECDHDTMLLLNHRIVSDNTF